MINNVASSHVDRLFYVAARQFKSMTWRGKQKAVMKSQELIKCVRDFLFSEEPNIVIDSCLASFDVNSFSDSFIINENRNDRNWQ
jgi:hypothetical protein